MPRTRRNYAYWADRCDRWLRDNLNVRLARARPEHLLAWWDELPPGARTRNQARHALRGYYAWALDVGRRANDPSEALPSLKVPKHLPRALSHVQGAKFRVASIEYGLKVAVLCHVLLYAGPRREETQTLRWTQVADGYVRVRGKGSRDRVVPSAGPLAEVLERWRPACPDTVWLLPSTQQAGHVSASWINDQVRQVGESAGVDGVFPHMLRATFATRLHEQGVGIRTIQALMGHSQISTTEKYLMTKPAHLREAVDRLDFD